MKLIKQAILSFRQGRSDKVYEVDLCEVSAGRYVVNFRYGRRGSALREGSKTVAPVDLAEAERTFRALVESKTKKGYTEDTVAPGATAAAGAAAAGPARASGGTSDADDRDHGMPGPRERVILERLGLPIQPRGNKLLSRAIWRAGELALARAEPALIELTRRFSSAPERDSFMLRYCTSWALGRCGGRDAIATLESIRAANESSHAVHHMATEALRAVYRRCDPAAFEAFVAEHIARLPEPLDNLARNGPGEEFEAALRAEIERGITSAERLLEDAYLVDGEHVRPALLSILRDVPIERDRFRAVRRIFKAAEFRRDGQVFGVIGYRVEKTRPRYLSWSRRRDKTEPFRQGTRDYLRRRVWRTLRRLGRDGSPDFVKMAVGVLLPFTDEDGGSARSRRYYRWGRPDETITWDRFAGFWAFNHLLYGHSPRYRSDGRGRAFVCAPSYQPGDAAPAQREESFPELWERTPAGLLHLIDESGCERVHEFAAKALRACPDFLDELDAQVVIMLLHRPYEATTDLGFDLAKRLYTRTFDDAGRIDLISAVVGCRLPEARRQARAWFDILRARLSQHSRLWAELATSEYPDNREYARVALRAALFTDAVEKALIGRIFAAILELPADEDERIADIGATLLACFASQLSTVSIEVIGDLLGHPATAAHELAGRILLEHGELSRALPDRVLYELLGSKSEAVRALGAQLMAGFSDRALAQHHELLLLLSTHEHADLRVAIRPVIQRLAAGQPAFAEQMVDAFVAALMSKQEKGVHSHLLALLTEDLASHLGRVPKGRVLELLHHRHPHAQELGGVLLAQNIGPDELSVAELIKLASHEILAVRRGSWAMCEKAIDRLKRAMPTAIRLLDARWQDSRAFAFEFFRTRFSRDDLSPEILVAICDSVRPDVQRFGREMITRYFEEEHGQTYLARLAEHPSTTLQLFASSYLEEYAAGDARRIAELEPFFVSILSRVNRGRVAKRRVIAFLHREALESADSAAVAARIFARQSATIAVGEREAMIKAMVDIAGVHPGVELPIRIHEPRMRGAAQHDAGAAGDAGEGA